MLARSMLCLTLLLLGWPVLALGATQREAAPLPLPRAHAHNDYRHARPLADALEHGFCSVEADIHLVDGRLLVAHDLADTRADRTLEALYLDPLQDHARANDGRIYPGGPPVILLVDIKSDARPTYARLTSVLADYRPMLTKFTDEATTPAAVTVIISGNCDHEQVLADEPRWAAVDGRPYHLDEDFNRHQMPLISARWGSVFDWFGDGQMPEAERERLRSLVADAHAGGHIIRFWALPRRTWPRVYDEGVDLINVDDLTGLRDFLLERAQ